MRIRGIALLLLLSCWSLQGQHVSVGVKIGSTPLGVFEGTPGELTDASKRYTFGPSVEVSLPKGFAIEVDALYRRIGFDSDHHSNPVRVFVRERANAWEIPVVAKYRVWRARAVHPFVLAGYAPRVVSGSGYSRVVSSPFPIGPAVETHSTDYPVTHGFVTGGGVEVRARRVRFAPEVRYTHWSRRIYDVGFGGTHDFARQNQVQLLLGISWP
ncbi:MAG: hypothetical protein WDO18_13135 [Acidobacteriota bacterium]